MVSLKYREDVNYITVDGCSSQEKEEGEKSRKKQTQRDFQVACRGRTSCKAPWILKGKVCNFCGGNRISKVITVFEQVLSLASLVAQKLHTSHLKR